MCDAGLWRGLRGKRTADRPNDADGEAMTAVSDWVTEAAVERKARAQLQVLSGELSGGCDWVDNSEPLVAAERPYAP